MALIKCPECGKEISDKAKQCIHCGYPLNNFNNENKLYKIILTNRGINLVKCIKCLRDVTNMELQDARDAVNNSPYVIQCGLSHEKCIQIQSLFKSVGSTTIIEEDNNSISPNLQGENIEFNIPEIRSQSNDLTVINGVKYDISDVIKFINEYRYAGVHKYLNELVGASVDDARKLILYYKEFGRMPQNIETTPELEEKAFKKDLINLINEGLDDKKQHEKQNKPYNHPSIPTCPKCGSTSITAGQRGYSFWTGFLGSNKTVNRCANCGHTWTPGK